MSEPVIETRYTVESYFALVTSGDLLPEERVQLLEGVIVAEPPQNPRHASGITRVLAALRDAIGKTGCHPRAIAVHRRSVLRPGTGCCRRAGTRGGL